MKFSVGALLALCAAQTDAFVVQTPSVQGTSLSSSFRNDAVGTRTNQARNTPSSNTPGNSGMRPASPMSSPAGATARKGEQDTKKNEITVQGGSLKTWTFLNPSIDSVEVYLSTEGRPLDADVELWQGPDNTPHKMRVYLEDGNARPFNAIIQTPRGPNTIAIRNIGQMEFPMQAAVNAQANVEIMGTPRTVQGGALRTYPFDPMVDSVVIKLATDGRPLNARIELLQGPNNNKQVIELYTEDGMDRPFYAIIKTPGSGNVVRVVNTATIEFPMSAVVEAFQVADYATYSEPVLGGDSDNGSMGGVGQW